MLYCLHSDGNCNVKFRCFSLIPSDKKMRSLQQSDEASREVSAGDTETLRHWDTETLRHWDTETLRHRDTETLRHWDTETLTAIFLIRVQSYNQQARLYF